MYLKKNSFYIIKNVNSIGFSNPIISFEIFNYENKSKLSRSNKLHISNIFLGLGIFLSKVHNHPMTLIF